MQYIKIIHLLLLSIFGPSDAVLVQLQGSHTFLILFNTISDHIQHIQRQNILNIRLMTNDT